MFDGDPVIRKLSTEIERAHSRNAELLSEASELAADLRRALAENERLRAALPIPTSLHWLGDREDAEQTRHAMDMKGCVLYFDRQSDCLQFMHWLESAALRQSGNDRENGT